MTDIQAEGPTALRIILGRQLKALREKAGMSIDEAGDAIVSTRFTVRRMERAEGGLKPLTVRSLLHAYGVTDPDEVKAFLALCRQASQRGWWHTYDDVLPDWMKTFVGLEEAATLIRGYEPQCVPGLFQTADYARATIKTGFPDAPDAEADRRVGLRLARQEILDRDQPPQVWIVIDEGALRRPLATVGAALMRAQLDKLIKATERPEVTLQILPVSAGLHPAMYGLFYLLRFPDAEMPDVAYVETLAGALYHDKPQEAAAYLEVLDRLCAQATPAERTARVLRAIRKEI